MRHAFLPAIILARLHARFENRRHFTLESRLICTRFSGSKSSLVKFDVIGFTSCKFGNYLILHLIEILVVMNPLRCACKTFSVSSAYTCSDKHHHHHHHQDLWPAFATLQWSPAAWLSCLSNVDGVMAFTTGEWQSWFCMYLGLPLPSMCALGANNRRCPCQRPYDVNGDHILTCCHHKATRTRCHNHILACLVALVSLFHQAGFHADSKG